MTEEKKLLVAAIKDGTVIDHIAARQALKIINILNLAEHNNLVTVGLNLPSKDFGVKDLIKIAKRELTPEEVNQIAILAPKASINIIRDYEIVNKFDVHIPGLIEHIIVCPNPKCITNNEDVDTKFHVIKRNGSVKIKCHYCEKIFNQEEIREYKNN